MQLTIKENGYVIINGKKEISLNESELLELSSQIDELFYQRDIENELSNMLDENEISEEEFEKLSEDDDFIDDVMNEYKDRLSEDDTWRYILMNVLRDKIDSYREY